MFVILDSNFFNEFPEIKKDYNYKGYSRTFYAEFWKRLFDILFSCIGIILSIPIILIFSLLIKLETPGPAFYKQQRVGLNGRYFEVVKLRSMRIDAEENGPQWARQNDSRVTKVGSFIRKTRIDELPQFLNVLKGEMSIIGPRPERPFFTYQFNEETPGFVNRLLEKPGLTGVAQINGGYELTPKEKLKLDMWYINNISFTLDIKVFLKTIRVIFTGDGAR